jgi:8-oxo-dGTP diphosphatase
VVGDERGGPEQEGRVVKDAAVSVTAAVFLSPAGIAAFRRNAGKIHGGRWEFPGGKLELGETAEAGMRRELQEELGFVAGEMHALVPVVHHYAERAQTIRLFPFLIRTEERRFVSTDHDAIRWVALEDAMTLDWLEADIPVVEQVAGLV